MDLEKIPAEELHRLFTSLRTPQDVAKLLGVEYGKFVYFLYKMKPQEKYTTFFIPKKNGEQRNISAPCAPIKRLQTVLKYILQREYVPKSPVHGFTLKRNIVSNAVIHAKHRYILNIDLEDFFPTINFGRVRGMFMSYPFSLNDSVATVLAQLCCFDNHLPQGAPTSPIISNIICTHLDLDIMKFAGKQKIYYTRYADDITLSTYRKEFPPDVFDEKLNEVGAQLEKIIKDNGFKINKKKVRFFAKNQRQIVTGLVVNKFPNVKREYVRQIRAMLHAWEKHGPEKSQAEFTLKYDKKHRSLDAKAPDFKRVVRGKIDFLSMVKGHKNELVLKYRKLLAKVDPSLKNKYRPEILTDHLVFTEGKSDWKHLKKATEKLAIDFAVHFEEYSYDMGDQKMLQKCRHFAETQQQKPLIFIFDRDKPDTTKEVMDSRRDYKNWGNNVFSFAMPVPAHRQDHQGISLEFYYSDEELRTFDAEGRRLFLSSEFTTKSGRHKTDRNLTLNNAGMLKGFDTVEKAKIIGEGVFDFDKEEKSVALSKDKFAGYVLNDSPPFDSFNFTEFKKIFDIIQSILNENVGTS